MYDLGPAVMSSTIVVEMRLCSRSSRFALTADNNPDVLFCQESAVRAARVFKCVEG